MNYVGQKVQAQGETGEVVFTEVNPETNAREYLVGFNWNGEYYEYYQVYREEQIRTQ